jgi:hypothetical protein
LRKEMLIFSEDALAAWDDPESPRPVAVIATTKRAAARGKIRSFMPASLVEPVDISFGCRPWNIHSR